MSKFHRQGSCEVSIADMSRTHVTHMFCKSAGRLAVCSTCKNNPMHQLGMAKGREIAPPCRNGKCPYYVKAILYGVKK